MSDKTKIALDVWKKLRYVYRQAMISRTIVVYCNYSRRCISNRWKHYCKQQWKQSPVSYICCIYDKEMPEPSSAPKELHVSVWFSYAKTIFRIREPNTKMQKRVLHSSTGSQLAVASFCKPSNHLILLKIP